MRLKVANGEMGRGTHEADIGMEFWEHVPRNCLDWVTKLMLSGNFCAIDITNGDFIMG